MTLPTLAELPAEARDYYSGGRRIVEQGVPRRVAAWYRKGPMAPESELIRLAADTGAGLELERFRFEPAPPDPDKAAPAADSWGDGKQWEGPAGRGSVASGNTRRDWSLKNWSPVRLSLAPMYEAPMAGDSEELTRARRLYAHPDPAKRNAEPLRELLAREAARRAGKAPEAPARAPETLADKLRAKGCTRGPIPAPETAPEAPETGPTALPGASGSGTPGIAETRSKGPSRPNVSRSARGLSGIVRRAARDMGRRS